MALIRVAQYSSTPTLVTDYQAQNAHLQAFTNQLLTQQHILDAGTDQPVIKQGCYVSHGGSLYVADADTAITGSPADGSVYIRVSGTTSLTVEFVTDISGYAWNPVYSALTSSTYTLLPYLIVKASTVWTRYNFNPNGQSFGALQCTSIDTGQGATEVHLMDQNVRTIDNVTFSRLGIITSIRQIGFSGSTTGVMGAINIGELVNVSFQGWSSSVSQRVCILPSGFLFCVAFASGMDGAVVSTGVKTGGSTIATVEAELPDVNGILRVWRIA